MKKSVILLVIIGMLILLTYVFFRKNYLQCDLFYEIPNSDKDFYPNGYEFFHSKKEIDNYINRNKRTKDLREKLQMLDFDFKNYSYCVFYGRKAKKIYHSYKTTLLDDLSPSYAKPNGKTLVFVEYEDDDKGKGVFIYKTKKNIKLRGFYGI